MMRVPDWVDPTTYQMWACRLAAIYHNPKGSVGLMSEAIGGSRTMLHVALGDNGNGLTVDHCIKLESLLGREFFPREFFRPDIFLAEG